jgi:hypothetical protein
MALRGKLHVQAAPSADSIRSYVGLKAFVEEMEKKRNSPLSGIELWASNFHPITIQRSNAYI